MDSFHGLLWFQIFTDFRATVEDFIAKFSQEILIKVMALVWSRIRSVVEVT